MKTISYILLASATLAPLTSIADSFDTLLSDLNKRVTFVESSGSCYMKNDRYYCQTVIAKCPTGKKLIPFLSNCKGSTKNSDGIYDVYVNKNNNNDEAQLECSVSDYTFSEFVSAGNSVNVKSIAACSKFTAAQVSTWKNFADKIRH